MEVPRLSVLGLPNVLAPPWLLQANLLLAFLVAYPVDGG